MRVTDSQVGALQLLRPRRRGLTAREFRAFSNISEVELRALVGKGLVTRNDAGEYAITERGKRLVDQG